MSMTSSRPYLIRTLWEWISDNDHTAHLLVNAKAAGVSIPEGFEQNGQIVLNISSNAVKNLSMDNHAISFTAHFHRAPFDVYVPINAALAIYSKESGQGMVFDDSEIENEAPPKPQVQPPQKPQSNVRPSLKIVH
jgi:stringent starvation protein B